MPRAYSQDLRERVLAAPSPGALAARYHVGESTLRGWLRRERETGSAEPKPHAGAPGRSGERHGAPHRRGSGA